VWQAVLDNAARVRRLGDHRAGEWTGLYEVEDGTGAVACYLVAE
jgi:hypothetical protein